MGVSTMQSTSKPSKYAPILEDAMTARGLYRGSKFGFEFLN